VEIRSCSISQRRRRRVERIGQARLRLHGLLVVGRQPLIVERQALQDSQPGELAKLIRSPPGRRNVAIQLSQAEPNRVLRPLAVALQALRAVVESPDVLALAAGNAGIRDTQRCFGPSRSHQIGVHLVITPGVRIGSPVGSVKMQKLRFDPSRGLSAADDSRERQRAHEHGIGGKVESETVPVNLAGHRLARRWVHAHRGSFRKGNPALRSGPVLPGGRLKRVGEHAGGRRLGGDVGK